MGPPAKLKPPSLNSGPLCSLLRWYQMHRIVCINREHFKDCIDIIKCQKNTFTILLIDKLLQWDCHCDTYWDWETYLTYRFYRKQKFIFFGIFKMVLGNQPKLIERHFGVNNKISYICRSNILCIAFRMSH